MSFYIMCDAGRGDFKFMLLGDAPDGNLSVRCVKLTLLKNGQDFYCAIEIGVYFETSDEICDTKICKH